MPPAKRRSDGTEPHKWTSVEEDDLLDLYEDHPELYDFDHEKYSKSEVRWELYHNFTKALGHDIQVEDIDTRIRSFRSTYPRNKGKSGSGGGARSARTRHIQKRLAFLEPFMRQRKSKSSIKEMPSRDTLPPHDSSHDSEPMRESRILKHNSEEEPSSDQAPRNISTNEDSDDALSPGDQTMEEVFHSLAHDYSKHSSLEDSDTEVNTSKDSCTPERQSRKKKMPPVTKSFNTRSKRNMSRIEDEEEDSQQPVTPPKKRRGRPPKNKTNTQQSHNQTKSIYSQNQKKQNSRDVQTRDQPLDVSFDETQQSQSILKDAPKIYFHKTHSSSTVGGAAGTSRKEKRSSSTKKTDVAKPSTSSKRMEIESDDIVGPSQPPARIRKRHFPVSLAGLDADSNKGKGKDRVKSTQAKEKDQKTPDNNECSGDIVEMQKKIMTSLDSAIEMELKTQRSEVHMWVRLIEAKMNRIPQDNLREKMMHTINEMVINALDGNWPERKEQTVRSRPSAAPGSVSQLSSNQTLSHTFKPTPNPPRPIMYQKGPNRENVHISKPQNMVPSGQDSSIEGLSSLHYNSPQEYYEMMAAHFEQQMLCAQNGQMVAQRQCSNPDEMSKDQDTEGEKEFTILG